MIQPQTERRIGFFSAVAIIILLFAINGCAARIQDASKAILINAEKVKHSTNALVCVQDKEGRRYSFHYNTSCWRCKTVNVPNDWNVITMRNGKVFIEPVK